MPIIYLRRNLGLLTFCFFILNGLSTPSSAQPVGFPYAGRLYPYQGWSALVRGDNNTIGMAGATVALPMNISSMESNPAGLAMYLNGLAAMINKNSLNAPEMNRGRDDITEYQWGLGTSMPPWGFGITYYSPSSESVNDSEVSVRQLRFSAAYLVLKNTSIGASIEIAKGIRRFGGDDISAGRFSYQIGALYKFDSHWVLGLSYHPALDLSPSLDDDNASSIAGFNRDIRVPSIVNFGIGFMPNRFFRAGLSFLAVHATADTRLLYDQNVRYGQGFTLQPRLGASYVIAEYKNFKSELAVGSYYEVARVENLTNRVHGTFSLDINPYFVNTGVAADLSSSYKNWMVSVGVDIVRLLRTFEIIPLDPVPPLNGTFPKMSQIDADGLAEGFTQGEEKSVSPPTAAEVKQIVEDIPKRLEEKMGTNRDKIPPPDRKSSRKKKKKRNPRPNSGTEGISTSISR